MESQLFLHCICPICYFPYDAQDRIPRLITCSQGHTICSTCISTQASMSNPMQCPFDKQIIVLLDRSANRFPINRALLSIVEEGHANCSLHIDKKLDLICRQCKEQICDRCERKGAHQGHEVNVIEDAFEEAKRKLDGIKDQVGRIQKAIDVSHGKINGKQETWLKSVDAQFARQLSLLLKKREEVHQKVKEYCQGLRDTIHFESPGEEEINWGGGIHYWNEFIQKQTSTVMGTLAQPSLYQILDEDLELLGKRVEELVQKETEKVQEIMQEMEQITFSFVPVFESEMKLLCQISGMPEAEEASKVGTQMDFRWRGDWEKMGLFEHIQKAEEVYFGSILESVLETYKFRVEAVRHLSQDSSPNSPNIPPFYLCSFSCFLASDPQCGKLLKWYLLDSTLQNSEKKFNINELRVNKNLFRILEEKFAMLPGELNFEGLVLTKEEKALLNKKIQDYANKLLLINHVNCMLDHYMKENWAEACYMAKQIFKLEEKPDTYIDKVLKDGARVNCLKLALVIEQKIKAQDFESARELMNYLQGLVKTILKEDELHSNQIQLIMKESIESLPETVDKNEVEQLKETLSQFENTEEVQEVFSKALQSYSPIKKLQGNAEGLTEEQEAFILKEKGGENSAYTMKQLTNQMLSSLEPYVDFVNALNTFKQTMTFDERQRLSYIYQKDNEKYSEEIPSYHHHQ